MFHHTTRITWTLLCLSVLSFSMRQPKAAELKLKNLQGRTVKLSQYRGEIVVLNFWATWCGPCNQETPALVALARQFKGRIVFIGVSLDSRDTEDHIPAFLARYQVPYAIWLDPKLSAMKKFQLGEEVPDTVVVDADGVVRFRLLGELRPAELSQRLDWLLKGSTGVAPAPLVQHL